MFEWLFGSKTTEKPKIDQTKTESENAWAVEYLGQYLNSPLWKTPVLNFIQNNCLIFQDTEQNPFQYTEIFKSFTRLISELIDGMMKEVGISEELLEECIMKGLMTKRRRLFRQLLVCDNFLAFKKVMVKKNKEFEVEAMRELAKEDSGFKVEEKRLEKDLERMEIEKAIALSQAMQDKVEEEEERMIQMAIKESQEQEQRRQDKQAYSKLPELSPSKHAAFGSPLLDSKPIDELVKDRDNIIEEAKKLPHNQPPTENLEQRQKRFNEQRELIKAKAQQKRKEELVQFLAGKQEKVKEEGVVDEKVTEEELMRRKNLAKKLKGELGL